MNDVVLQVEDEETGIRLDSFLARELGLSRREVWRLLELKRVELDGKSVTLKAKGKKLLPGCVRVKPIDYSLVPYPDLGIKILQESKTHLVVDKPAGLPVMPRYPGKQVSVLNGLIGQYPEIQGLGEGGLRSGVVHRLDTDTSGVLVIARDQETWRALREAFSEHRATKHYLAIVHGQLEGAGHEVMNLRVAQHKPAKVRVVKDPRGLKGVRECRLSWQSLAVYQKASLLDIRLETGFLHQIRVMFAHKGHAVIGDKVYGRLAFPVARQMLHAAHIEVADIKASSPDPEDFAEILKRLKVD